jgi:hypothetical protein
MVRWHVTIITQFEVVVMEVSKIFRGDLYLVDTPVNKMSRSVTFPLTRSGEACDSVSTMKQWPNIPILEGNNIHDKSPYEHSLKNVHTENNIETWSDLSWYKYISKVWGAVNYLVRMNRVFSTCAYLMDEHGSLISIDRHQSPNQYFWQEILDIIERKYIFNIFLSYSLLVDDSDKILSVAWESDADQYFCTENSGGRTKIVAFTDTFQDVVLPISEVKNIIKNCKLNYKNQRMN